MSYRYMRVVVMFDLPTETSLDRRHYRWFRKFLINDGFVMMQESVYSKIVLNLNAANVVAVSLRRNKPPEGLVQMMIVTERQFARMEYIVGEKNDIYINNDERLVVL